MLVVAGFLGLRLLGMTLLPLMDTSEPRYAEIARRMAVSGDWITPWIESDRPFWGKPPLSFWMQALSIKLLGTSELAVRLPSWLAMLATLPAIHAATIRYAGRKEAAWAVLIYVSSALPYIAGGAVLTDPFLVMGMTWSMVGLMLPGLGWRAMGLFGLSVGLLAKGPLALVLVMGPPIICLLLYRRAVWPSASRWIWILGLPASIAIAIPWYAMAEFKTPGFLEYFLLGEHFRRFVMPGWQGDLYGSAHFQPYGRIWMYWLVAAFPWSIVALGALAMAATRRIGRELLIRAVQDPATGYLLGWALFTLLFFSIASNLLWTYALPALPSFAILLSRVVGRWESSSTSPRVWTARASYLVALVVPATMGVFLIFATIEPHVLRTEKALIAYVTERGNDVSSLWYVEKRPFSARYYSQDSVGLIQSSGLIANAERLKSDTYIAIPRSEVEILRACLSFDQIDAVASKDFVLARVSAQRAADGCPLQASSRGVQGHVRSSAIAIHPNGALSPVK